MPLHNTTHYIDAASKAGTKGGLKKKQARSEEDEEEEIVMLHASDEEEARPEREGKRGGRVNKEEELRIQRQAQQRKVHLVLRLCVLYDACKVSRVSAPLPCVIVSLPCDCVSCPCVSRQDPPASPRPQFTTHMYMCVCVRR